MAWVGPIRHLRFTRDESLNKCFLKLNEFSTGVFIQSKDYVKHQMIKFEIEKALSWLTPNVA